MVQSTNIYSSFADKIILGSWLYGKKHWTNVNDKDSLRTIRYAKEKYGINRLDTAPAYGNGHAEEVIKAAISAHRDDFLIYSKCGLKITPKGIFHDLSPETIREDIEGSLRRLGTDRLDAVFFHWPDKNVPLEKSLKALLDLKNKGYIKAIGLSNYPSSTIASVVNDFQIDFAQFQYSLINQTHLTDIAHTSSLGVKVFVYGCLQGGLLTDKTGLTKPFVFKKSAKTYFYHQDELSTWEKYLKVYSDINKNSDHLSLPLSSRVIQKTLSFSSIDAIILGCRTITQLNENLPLKLS